MADQNTTEEVTNCITCNKPLRKAKRYYRNSKYYCNKRCWKNSANKDKQE